MNDETKERIKAQVRLSEWVSRAVKLTGGPEEWKGLCPFHPDKNPSFTVADGKGFYHCFSCGASGDVFDWVQQRQGVPFSEALKMVASEVGIAIEPADQGERLLSPRSRTQPPREPIATEKFRALEAGGAVSRYLTEQRRIPSEILARYSVGETTEGDAYAFAYKQVGHAKKPRTEFMKVVKLQRDDAGKKVEWRHPKGGRNILFGMLAVGDDRGSLIITEGEIDAMSWAAYGYAAVSVPCGAKSTTWIDECWDWLQDWAEIHINFDEDTAGRAKVEDIVKRLGSHRADIVRLPFRQDTTQE